MDVVISSHITYNHTIFHHLISCGNPELMPCCKEIMIIPERCLGTIKTEGNSSSSDSDSDYGEFGLILSLMCSWP